MAVLRAVLAAAAAQGVGAAVAFGGYAECLWGSRRAPRAQAADGQLWPSDGQPGGLLEGAATSAAFACGPQYMFVGVLPGLSWLLPIVDRLMETFPPRELGAALLGRGAAIDYALFQEFARVQELGVMREEFAAIYSDLLVSISLEHGDDSGHAFPRSRLQRLFVEGYGMCVHDACLAEDKDVAQGAHTALRRLAWQHLFMDVLGVPSEIPLPEPYVGAAFFTLPFAPGPRRWQQAAISQETDVKRFRDTIMGWRPSWAAWTRPDDAWCDETCTSFRLWQTRARAFWLDMSHAPMLLDHAWQHLGFFSDVALGSDACPACCPPCAITAHLEIGATLAMVWDADVLASAGDLLLPQEAVQWILRSSLSVLLSTGWAASLAKAMSRFRAAICASRGDDAPEWCGDVKSWGLVTDDWLQRECAGADDCAADTVARMMHEIAKAGSPRLDAKEGASRMLESAMRQLRFSSFVEMYSVPWPLWELLHHISFVSQWGDVAATYSGPQEMAAGGIPAQVVHFEEMLLPGASGTCPELRIAVPAASIAMEEVLPRLESRTSRTHRLDMMVTVHVGDADTYRDLPGTTRYLNVASAFHPNFWSFECDFSGDMSPGWVASQLGLGYCPSDCVAGRVDEFFGRVLLDSGTCHASSSLRVSCRVPPAVRVVDVDDVHVRLVISGPEGIAAPAASTVLLQRCWGPGGRMLRVSPQRCYKPPHGPLAAGGALPKLPPVYGEANFWIRTGPVVVARRLMSACLYPFFDYASVEAAAPGYFVSWLRYHLEILGIDHLHIYDTDGTFEAVVAPWAALGRVTYIPRINDFLSPGIFGPLSREGQCQGCLKTVVADHCLFSNRHSSHWVILLRAFDKWLNSPASGERQDFRAFAANALEQPAAFWQIPVVNFGTPPLSSSAGASHIVSRDTLRCPAPLEQWDVPMVRPEKAVQFAGHTAVVAHYDEEHRFDTPFESPTFAVAEHWRANHYVDLLRPRCECCKEEDDRLAWAVPFLG